MVTRVGHIGLQTPDLERSVAHAETILGLREVERVDGTSYLTCNSRHHELELLQADAHRLDHLAFEVSGADALAHIEDRVRSQGFGILDVAGERRGVERSVRVVGPGGFVFELFCGMQTVEPAHYNTVGIRPLKFEHITLKSTDKDAMEGFLVDVLGLRVSDRAEDAISWLRASDEHHGVSIIRADVDQLHHYAWQIAGWNEIARVGDHLLRNGRRFLWGPGHHGIGDNYFCYFLDDDGSIVEYSANILRIENESSYAPAIWPDTPLSVNRWGNPEPPDAFLTGGTTIWTPAPAGAVSDGR